MVRDYCAIADDYIERVLFGEQPACRWVRLACERQRRDLARQGEPGWPWKFDKRAAAKFCYFAERMPHVEGRWKSKTIQLEPWQCFIFTTIFGWVDDAGLRRFRKALVVIPRKNSKTTCAAIVALYLLVADREPGAQVYSAAKTRDQARLAWSVAHKMVQRTPALRDYFGLQAMAHSIVCDREGGFYKPLSRDADSLEGLNVHGALVDELHVHPDREVWDVIDNGITARSQPLIFAISTEGDASAGIFVDQVKYIQAILDGQHEDESYFAIYYGLDVEDDWTNPEVWPKANPNWGVSVSAREMQDKFREAQQLPSAQATFLTKRLNVRVGAGKAYFNMLAWRQVCKDESLSIEQFQGEQCIVTVDLASKSDLTCAMKVFRRGGHYYVFGDYYLPQSAVEPGMPNHELYRGWRIAERLHVTEGSRTDYEFLERDLLAFHEEYRPQRMGGDPNYNAEQFRQHMEAAGVTFVEIPHSVKQFSEPMKDLAALIVSGRIHHNGDPILDWALGNVTAKTDVKGNVYPRKDHPDKKIDPAVALIANMSEQSRVSDELSMYEDPLTAAM